MRLHPKPIVGQPVQIGRTVWEPCLVHLDRNARPYFSLTGTRYRSAGWASRAMRGLDVADGWIDTSGALTENIPKQLEPVARVHLADDDGRPMHAEDNGWYFYSGAARRHEEDRPSHYPPNPLSDHERAARALNIDPTDLPRGYHRHAFGRIGFRMFVATLADRWADDAARAIETMLPDAWIIRRDGIIVAVAPTESDAYHELHRLQGQSWEWAIEHEGYTVKPNHYPVRAAIERARLAQERNAH